MRTTMRLIHRILSNKLYVFIIGVLLLITLINTAVIGYLTYKPKPLCDKCNVILISLDTLSALHIPCYGYSRDTSPNLCAFAKNNILFSNSYSESNWTLASDFSNFTSLYPYVNQMTQPFGPPLNEKYLTLAQVFRQNGYQTILNVIPVDVFNIPLQRGIARGFNIIQSPDVNDLWTNSYPELLKSAKENRPFFAYFHTYYVHSPYLTGHESRHLYTNQPEYPNIPLTPEEYHTVTPEFLQFLPSDIASKYAFLGKIDNGITLTLEKIIQTKDINRIKNLFESLPDLDKLVFFDDYYHARISLNNKNQVHYVEALYDEKIFDLDQNLKGLFDFIDNSPLLKNNTIVVITSEHGEEFMEHGNFQHGVDLYKTNTFVPLIMRVPGIKNKVITNLVQGIDIYPTVLGLTGLSPLSPIQGLDLTGLIRGDKNAKTNKFVLSENTVYPPEYAIQSKNWRLYYVPDNGHKELYNLTLDPVEQNNVASANPGIVDQLTKMLLTNEQN